MTVHQPFDGFTKLVMLVFFLVGMFCGLLLGIALA